MAATDCRPESIACDMDRGVGFTGVDSRKLRFLLAQTCGNDLDVSHEPNVGGTQS